MRQPMGKGGRGSGASYHHFELNPRTAVGRAGRPRNVDETNGGRRRRRRRRRRRWRRNNKKKPN